MTTPSPAELEIYRETARARQRAALEQSRLRRERGWQIAREAAALLRVEISPCHVLH